MEPILKHHTLSGALLDELRQAILDGRHPAGSQLRQDALAETYGVSRIPVREVLLQLEAEGLVRIVPRRGAVVSGLSREEIADVFELRLLLEARLYTASAPRMTGEDLDRATAVNRRYERAIRAGQVSAYGELNAELHAALYARAQLPRSEQIVHALLKTSERYTRIQLSTADALTRAMEEHEELIRLTRAGRFDEGAALLAAHIGGVRDDLLRVADIPH